MKVQQKGRVIWMERKIRLRLSELPHDDFSWLCPEIHTSWKDECLNWSLIMILDEDVIIKEGLFPTPGRNTTVSQGGSKPKTEYQWMLAKALFEQHIKYKEENSCREISLGTQN